ncbi:MAG: paraquat-inducible protein A [Ferruginibacter sp.]|nr:paraquat-inducible protein A [Ferruginibacter sp.]
MNRLMLLLMHVLSLVVLGFGLVLDLLKIDISANFFVDIHLFNETRSVLGTLQSLWEGGNYFPFLLIFSFGLIVPLVKSGIVFYILLSKDISGKWQKLVAAISKWAMADVFAVSILIAFLGARAMSNTSATLEPGFYFFTAYVLWSSVIINFLSIKPKIPLLSNV